MPWRETCVMDERLQFVAAYQAGKVGMAELCRAAGISRKTGYKWIERYLSEGEAGLRDRSRAPHVQARRTADDIALAILAYKDQHQDYGPKKIRARLSEERPEVAWPAVSTMGGLLAAHGRVKPQTRRRRTPPYPHPLLPMEEPNAVWTADFKGQFATGDGQLCYPLTVADGCSRYLITCRGMPKISRVGVFRSFNQAFREHGLPDAIRTDNGPPFSNRGLGISKLTVWWWKLGIRHERIEPGHPEQNGRHERMHRTLKAATAQPPATNLASQQRRFDAWRREYNQHRPHEALGQRPPSAVFEASRRPLPQHLPEVSYPDGYVVRQVRQNGSIKWHSRLIFVCTSLVGDPIGLSRFDDQRWRVYFMSEPIGIFDEHLNKVLPM
jgi:transposase InsO family protein